MAADDFVRIVRLVDENGNYIATLPVSLAAGEISIGAIELKDGITDDRAEVTPDLRLSTNANQQVGDADVNNANPVPVDATGQGDVPVTLDSEQVDVSDRVARDLGKVNVADVDGFDSVKGQKAMTESFPVVLPSDQASVPVDATVVTSGGAGATIGVTTGAKVVTDGVGTVQQYLRGLVTLVAAKIGITVADGDNAALGTTTGAAVVTDAAGSVQQYLRGIVKLLISIISVKIDQTTPGTTNKVWADPVTATPVTYNVTLTVADTEYSQAMPANCRAFEFQARTDVAIRWQTVTGKVATPTAPYDTLKAGDYYYSYDLNQGASPSTLYFGSAIAGTVVEIKSWA